MGILSRAGAALGITYEPSSIQVREGTPQGVLPPPRSGASSVTLDAALTLPAVYRSISILSTAASQLEMKVWRSGAEIPTPSLVSQPDVDQSLSQFVKRTVIGLAGVGEAFWLIFRKSDGMVSGLEVLNPLEVSVYRNSQGNKVYTYRGRDYAANQVKHLRLLEIPGHDNGVGPIQACRQGLSGALALRTYSDHWFSDGSVPTGVLSTDKQLTPDESDAYRDRWHELQASRDVAVLSQGLKYEPIVLRPADAQFLESQQFSVTDVARMFGIPASYLLAEVNGSSLTYTNVRDVDLQFVRYTLLQYLVEIEDAMSSVLVRGQVAKFNLDEFLRPDPKTQAEIDRAYIEMGVVSRDEIRAQRGLSGPAPTTEAPAEDGDAQNARGIAEMIQKLYLGVGKVISEDEARALLNRAGAGLEGSLPEPEPTPLPAAPQAPSTTFEEATSDDTDPQPE